MRVGQRSPTEILRQDPVRSTAAAARVIAPTVGKCTKTSAYQSCSALREAPVTASTHGQRKQGAHSPAFVRSAKEDAQHPWGIQTQLIPRHAHVDPPAGTLLVQGRRGVAADLGLPNDAVLKNGRYEIPRLPGLTSEERAVEGQFIRMYEADAAGMVKRYAQGLVDAGKQVFETDAAKQLFPGWMEDAAFKALPDVDKSKVKEFRGGYSRALHQVAHAVVKQAFLMRLDAVKADPWAQVMVTCGGCTAGKGSVMLMADQDPRLKSVVDRVGAHGATFDAAGEQYATDNAWILAECQKRNIPVAFIYVHNDVTQQVDADFRRAKYVGRVVPGKEFVRSYLEGSRNMEGLLKSGAFKDAAAKGMATAVFIDNSKTTFDGEKETNRAVRVSKLPRQYAHEAEVLRVFVERANVHVQDGSMTQALYAQAVGGLMDLPVPEAA